MESSVMWRLLEEQAQNGAGRRPDRTLFLPSWRRGSGALCASEERRSTRGVLLDISRRAFAGCALSSRSALRRLLHNRMLCQMPFVRRAGMAFSRARLFHLGQPHCHGLVVGPRLAFERRVRAYDQPQLTPIDRAYGPVMLVQLSAHGHTGVLVVTCFAIHDVASDPGIGVGLRRAALVDVQFQMLTRADGRHRFVGGCSRFEIDAFPLELRQRR